MSTLTLLLQQRLREWRNDWRAVRHQSRLKVWVIALFATGFELGLAVFFLCGFRFLDQLGAGTILIDRLFALYFLGMTVLLVLSAATAAYGTFFRAGDVSFLLSAPVTVTDIVLLKWIETARVATWAYLFIVLPFVTAYAYYIGASLLFVLGTALFSVPLLALCAAAGALVALLLARYAPRGRAGRLTMLLLCLAAAAWAAGLLLRRTDGAPDEMLSFSRLVPGLRLASHPLLPGYWMSEGLGAVSAGHWTRAGLFWLLLASTAAVLGVALEVLAGRIYFDAWSRASRTRRADGAARLLPQLVRLLAPLPADARALIVKDARLFCRDPLQWTQVAVFFGLLAIYFANLRTFRYHLLDDVWRDFIAFLNAFSIAAVLGSLTSRFIYPQLSLEGHSFWLLGLSPATLPRVLRIKFLSALPAMLLVTVPLMWLSTSMLRTPVGSRLTIAGLTVCVATALTGLAAGLGALFLDTQNRNPAAIVSGFGGTLNLVLSLAVELALLLPFGILSHLHTAGRLADAGFVRWQAVAWVWALLVTAAATVLPLCAGAAELRRRDF